MTNQSVFSITAALNSLLKAVKRLRMPALKVGLDNLPEWGFRWL